MKMSLAYFMLHHNVSYLAKQQQRFLQFVLQNFGFNLFQRTAIDAEQTTTAFAVGYSGGSFLKEKHETTISKHARTRTRLKENTARFIHTTPPLLRKSTH